MIRKINQVGILIFLTSISVFGQENFIPTRPDNVSEKDYNAGEYILKNAYQQVAEHDNQFVAADYWNFAVAYYQMGQPKERIYDFLFKSRAAGTKDFCEIINYYHKVKHGIDSAGMYKLLGEDYRILVSDCSTMLTEETFDIDKYIKENNYDKELIYKLNDLITEDQKWRNGSDEDLKKQNKVDSVNILKAEEIIKKYGYPGEKMVGRKFSSVIFIVIQHADLNYQEKYLPLLAKAVDENELGKSALRMLLDRIYHKKTGHQIFGSQVGVPFSDDKTIEEVKQKYNL